MNLYFVYLAGPPEKCPATVAGHGPVMDTSVLQDGLPADAAVLRLCCC